MMLLLLIYTVVVVVVVVVVNKKKLIKVSIFSEVGRKKLFPFFVCGAVSKLR